jgi:Sec-independent protein translocase protein TatA
MISMSEIALIGLVSLFAFGPKQFPQLVRLISHGLIHIQRVRSYLANQWETMLKQQTLLENQKKAEAVEKNTIQQEPPV